MLPFLKIVGDRNEYRRRNVIEDLSSHFSLTDEEREQIVPRGHGLFENRCDWALVHLKKYGLIRSTGYGHFRITERGLAVLKVLNQNPEEIENAFSQPQAKLITYLDQRFSIQSDEEDSPATLESSIREIYQRMQDGLETELLQKIKDNSSDFFETHVIKLLVKMGYGGSLEDAETVGRSGDGGIDGIIKEDPLGLDMIYVQAKRWDGNVGRPDLQKFVGALHGRHAKKGIFITTSDFTELAIGYAERIASNIILIDGNELVQLMIRHDVGVSTIEIYETKRVDSDYFAENTE